MDRRLGSGAAETPVQFQNHTTILTANLAASRLRESLREDVLSDIETAPSLLTIPWLAAADSHKPVSELSTPASLNIPVLVWRGGFKSHWDPVGCFDGNFDVTDDTRACLLPMTTKS